MTFTVTSFQTYDAAATTRSGTPNRVVGFLCTGTASAVTDSVVLATYINSGSVSSILQASVSTTTATAGLPAAFTSSYGAGSVTPGTVNATGTLTTISGFVALV